jgi:hypothetical protein
MRRTTMASYRNKNLCFYCKHFNHRQEECRTRYGCQRQKILAKAIH